MKSEKGITLVALILVFLVLLILAGISISLVVSDNNSSKESNVTPSTTNTYYEYDDEIDVDEEDTTEENEIVDNEVENAVEEDNTVYSAEEQ